MRIFFLSGIIFLGCIGNSFAQGMAQRDIQESKKQLEAILKESESSKKIVKETSVKKIMVVGAGYVGLVTGACFALKGSKVILVENNPAKIDMLLAGQVPFYEPGLDALVAQGIAQSTLQFVSSVAEGLKYKPDIVFSCVGTPPLPDGAADLSYVWQVAKEIGNSISEYCLVVNKSTVPVGTTARVQSIINEQLAMRGVSVEFDVASNPEFLKEGDALKDFLQPDRVVVGVKTKKAEQILYELYEAFIQDRSQFIVMNVESSELTKYASNAMLATRISFMNQLALLADTVGADIERVKVGMATDRRIGKYFLNAGIGYGGSCFPKDVKALVHLGQQHQVPMTLVQTVDNVNEKQRKIFGEEFIKFYGGHLAGKVIGIWGLAFKPETDDIRCAPALDIIKQLLSVGARVIAYDPIAMDNVKQLLGTSITYAASAKEVLEKSHALMILTEWKEFVKANPLDFLALQDKVVFDGRNCFDPADLRILGLTYCCIGRNLGAHADQPSLLLAMGDCPKDHVVQ